MLSVEELCSCFDIYGGVSGLIDYGPVGAALEGAQLRNGSIIG